MKDEKFIRNWEKSRRKGKEKFVVTNGIMMGIGMFAGSTISTLARGREYYLDTHLGFFFGGLIGGIIGSSMNWPKNEEKYNRLVNNDSDK